LIVGIGSIVRDYRYGLGPMASSQLPESDVVRIDLFWSMCIAIDDVRVLVPAGHRFGARPMVVWGAQVAVR